MSLGYKASLTIDHTQVGSSDSTDFPLFFAGNVGIKTIGNGGSYVQLANGHDIQFFSDSALTSILDYELVSWDATTGLGEWWIRIPTLSHSVDTVIYVGVGDAGASDRSNATSVWTSKYLGVWHGGDGSSVSLNDSTSHSNNATSTIIMGSPAAFSAITGQLGGGIHQPSDPSFDLRVAQISTALINSLTAFTWQSWGKSNGGRLSMWGAGDGSSWTTFYEGEFSPSSRLFLNGFGLDVAPGIPFINGSWTKVDLVAGGGNVILYKNASSFYSTASSGTVTATAGKFNFAADVSGSGGTTNPFQGDIDEIRVVNTNLSADYLTAEYNNQKSSSTLLTLSGFSATTAADTLYWKSPKTQPEIYNYVPDIVVE